MTPTMVFPQTPRNVNGTLVNADGTASKTIYTAPANGVRIDALNFASTDTSARDVQLIINKSGTDYLVGTISVPIGAGNTSGAGAKNALADANIPLAVADPYGNKVIWLEGNAILKVLAPVAITAAKQITITGLAAEY